MHPRLLSSASHSAAIMAFLVLPICPPVRAQDYYGIKIKTGNVAFLLDVSGSMEDKDEGVAGGKQAARALDEAGQSLGRRVGGRLGGVIANRVHSETTKLGAARRELIRALNGLTAESRFTIFRFGDSVAEWPGGFRNVGGVTRRLAQGYVAQLNAQGGTPMNEVLGSAFAIADVKVIFLVSDGLPTDSSGSAILDRLPSLDRGRKIVINTIGIGPDQDGELLCELARRTGGYYVRDGKIACQGSACESPEAKSFQYLYPISPYQTSKEYRETKQWSADPRKIPPDSAECKTKSTQPGSKPRCLYTYVNHRDTMSSFYLTDKNELVKGIWTVEYSERDESVGTLAIKGTSIFADPHPDPEITNALQTVPGHTFRVEKREFSCFEPLSEEERRKAQDEMRKAQADPSFTRKGPLYIMKPSR